jgi:hypothetical protein
MTTENTERESLCDARPQIGDVVLTDTGRQGVYYGDGRGSYGAVVFLDDASPDHLGVPWSALQATDLWRCWCPGGRFWRVSTAPVIRCDRCGFARG